MRIAIYGASGRVGTRLVEAVLADPALELAAALVSPQSPRIGTPVDGAASIEYRPANAALKCPCDVIIDFTNPAASLSLQAMLGDKPQPVVIGTTGFGAADQAALDTAAAHRPLLVAANFALGFEPFLAAVETFAAAQPGAEPVVEEIYHRRKKPSASGTSLRLVETVRTARGIDADPHIAVRREGDVTGVNAVDFRMGVSDVRMTFTVNTLAAYAEGAIAAARWLAAGRGAGRYDLADTFARHGGRAR